MRKIEERERTTRENNSLGKERAESFHFSAAAREREIEKEDKGIPCEDGINMKSCARKL
jgi:hypothetical protein